MVRRRRSRLSRSVQQRLLEYFVAGTPARTAAELLGIHRNSAILFYCKLREVILARTREAQPFGGEVEVDESYFGARRKKGPPGRGAASKVPVFGLLKRRGQVHAVMIPNVRGATLMPIIRQRVAPDALVYSDGYFSYDALDVSEFRHVRVDKGRGYAQGRAHINGIENFWSQAKRHLRRYNGIPRQSFHLFLAECEWRFNYAPPRRLLSTLANWTGLGQASEPQS
ncbi:IS1595 family transposase [Falsiroseomonas oryzae]|uniref:IS1595 family transposase n=1 Tax=Falsiroseomonas oryzae TaxID=2766473 RepID=UPI0022EAF75B|nr:IS1595 family transposase [Roseomonas sp. MO-31]